MAKSIAKLELSGQQRQELTRLVQASTSTQREVRRARIVLLRAQGKSQEATAAAVGVNRPVVSLWERRFRSHGLAGLNDAKGRGRKASIAPQVAQRVLTQAVQPPLGRTRWSVRSMAQHAQISPAQVQRLWSANDIKPHVLRTFKLSRDKDFEAKFWDVIGLYLNPPERALVLCCDEKSQCQALQRTQPGLPLGIGHIRTRTHDYVRHGTVTLFAAMSYLDGKIISRIAAKHDHAEWLRFLKQIDRQTPAGVDLHLIADNYGTHKHPEVKDWLAKHPRFHMHYVPTSSSWLYLVERFFRDLSEEAISEGSFSSVRDLTLAIEIYLAQRNLDPKPYRWRAKGADILAKIQRAREAMARQSQAAASYV
ncbi:MAG: IS630 family transposase [Burkholderiales bacterium]